MLGLRGRRYALRSQNVGGMNEVGINRTQRLLIEEYAVPKSGSIVAIVASTPVVRAQSEKARRDAELDAIRRLDPPQLPMRTRAEREQGWA